MSAKQRKHSAPMTETADSYIAVTAERIAVRAYEKWQQGGCVVGDGQHDWFCAQDELTQEARDHSGLAS